MGGGEEALQQLPGVPSSPAPSLPFLNCKEWPGLAGLIRSQCWAVCKQVAGVLFCRSQIWDRAVDWLGSQGELSSEQLASTLLALSLLKPMDGAEVSAT